MKSLLLTAASLVALTAATLASEMNVQFIVDNGAGLQEPGRAQPVINSVFYEMTQLERKRASRDAEINVVTTSSLNDVAGTVWAGNPRAVRTNFEEISASIAHIPNGCTDLVRAINEVAINIRRSNAKEIRVVMVSSLLHTGRPCGDVKIVRPQAVPAGAKIADIIADPRVKQITILFADREQRNVWLEALDLAGAGIRVRNDTLTFDVKNVDETLALIEKGGLFND